MEWRLRELDTTTTQEKVIEKENGKAAYKNKFPFLLHRVLFLEEWTRNLQL